MANWLTYIQLYQHATCMSIQMHNTYVVERDCSYDPKCAYTLKVIISRHHTWNTSLHAWFTIARPA